MKIGDSPGAAGASRLERKRDAGSARRPAASSAAPADQITLAGVPEAELTPRVREALISLMQEVQSLRDQLTWSQERINELERLADSDPMLDIYNRRAFVRELDRALGMIDRYGMKASLIFVDLNDLKKINDQSPRSRCRGRTHPSPRIFPAALSRSPRASPPTRRWSAPTTPCMR